MRGILNLAFVSIAAVLSDQVPFEESVRHSGVEVNDICHGVDFGCPASAGTKLLRLESLDPGFGWMLSGKLHS